MNIRHRAIVVGWVLLLGGSTYARNLTWVDELSVWTDATAKTPLKPRPWINLGLAREVTGDFKGGLMAQQVAFATSYQPRLSLYQQKFSQAAAQINIARILAVTGHEEEAGRILDGVITTYPLFPHARYNRAVWFARQHRCAEGWPDAQLAMQLEPGFPALQCQPN